MLVAQGLSGAAEYLVSFVPSGQVPASLAAPFPLVWVKPRRKRIAASLRRVPFAGDQDNPRIAFEGEDTCR